MLISDWCCMHQFFCHFWLKSGKILALTSLKFSIFSYNCNKFPLRWFYNHCFLLQKIWKKPNDITCFFTFFTTLDIIWPKFCPKTTPNLILFASFQWSMLGNSIDIKKFNWNPVLLAVVLKKFCYFLVQLVQNWGPHGLRPKQKTFFFGNNKTRC